VVCTSLAMPANCRLVEIREEAARAYFRVGLQPLREVREKDTCPSIFPNHLNSVTTVNRRDRTVDLTKIMTSRPVITTIV
jgi:hypothetical protein